MKNLFIFFILILGLIIPLACSDKGNNPPTNPKGPVVGGGTPTFIPSGTQTPRTPTQTPFGAATATPTVTFVLPTPVFQHNVQTSASPNSLVMNVVSGGYALTAAEYETTSKGIAMGVELIKPNAGGTLNISGYAGSVLQGFPTPNSTPPWVPVTTGLSGPQGFVNPGGSSGYAAILDIQSGGGAKLYEGWSYSPPFIYNGWSYYGYGYWWQPTSVNGYCGIPFKNPKGLTADTNNNIYVADTGNGFVEEFMGPALDYSVVPEHFWNGFEGVTVGGTGVTFKSPSVFFKAPYAVACDPLGYVWVSDTGPVPSTITEYTSGAPLYLNPAGAPR